MDNLNKDFDKKIKELANEEKIEVPKDIQDKIDETLKNTVKEKKEKPRNNIFYLKRFASIAACFVVVMIFAMPNISSSYASAAQNIPFLGKLFKVVTIRQYDSQNGNDLEINTPQIKNPEKDDLRGGPIGDNPQVAPQIVPDSNAVDDVNEEVQALTDKIMAEFYEDNKEAGNHQSVYTNYEVVINTDRWFTLAINVRKVSASSYTYYVYYNIDKLSGKIVPLKDLFKDESYNEIITAEIKKQMREQMADYEDVVFWIDSENPDYEFVKLGEKQNYYFSEEGELYIQFDKYEVGPGSMGTPCFVIRRDVLEGILKPEFKNVP